MGLSLTWVMTNILSQWKTVKFNAVFFYTIHGMYTCRIDLLICLYLDFSKMGMGVQENYDTWCETT